MSQLLLLSLDCLSSPSITLKTSVIEGNAVRSFYGRGFAWYNNDELFATIIKEPKISDDHPSMLAATMQDISKFYASLFIGCLHEITKQHAQKNTQPFNRSYAGRNWVFVHDGKLSYPLPLSLDENSFFEPIGNTDSERIFCYLLEKIKKEKGRSIQKTGWENLHNWIMELNELGTLNIMMSDGVDTVIYQDRNAYHPLYWLRSCPPRQESLFESDHFKIELLSPLDIHHSLMLVCNKKTNDYSIKMNPKQMIIIRRGQIIYNSDQTSVANISENNDIVAIKNNHQHDQLLFITKKEISKKDKSSPHQIIDYIMSSKRYFYSIDHETIYRYDQPVYSSNHLFRLHPVNDHIQATVDYQLLASVSGNGEFFEDVFGNIATFYKIDDTYTELIIKSHSIVSIADNPSLKSDFLHQKRSIPLVWLPWQRQMLSPYLLPPELPESELNELIEFAMSFVKRNDYDLMEVLNDINNTIYHDFNYLPGETNLTTTPYELYITRKGVCQDFANLFICLARLLHVPARYRVGYIYTAADYENKIQSEESHAWVEVYLPYIGWYGLDPTNGCIANHNHIRVACGRSYVDASPTSGTIYKGGGHEELSTSVLIRLIDQYDLYQLA